MFFWKKIFSLSLPLISSLQLFGQGTWVQKTNVVSNYRGGAVGFSIGNKGYIGTGWTFTSPVVYYNDLWEWDQMTNTSTQKANFTGSARGEAVGFSIGTKGYIGTGVSSTGQTNDFYEWDQATNTWTQKANFPRKTEDIDRGSFTIGCHGYFACGFSNNTFYRDLWEYTPDNFPPVNAAVTSSTSLCSGSSVILSASGGTNYSWSTGSVAATITVAPTVTTSYSVIVSDYCGSTTLNTTVSVIDSSRASFFYEYDPCLNKCVLFTDNSFNPITWIWDFGDGQNSSSQNYCHYYNVNETYSVSLIVNNSTNCADTFKAVIPYEDHDTVAYVYIPNAFSPNDDGENDLLQFYLLDTFCLEEFEITIYDRWGEKVFETTDLNKSWDGIYQGKRLTSATLIYYCRTTTQTSRKTIRKGNILLIR